MSDTTVRDHTSFIIPPSIITAADIARLVREFEQVDAQLTTVAARQKAGMQEEQPVSLSISLTEFLTLNNLQPRTGTERTALIKQLRLLKVKAPVIHMTFASEADPETLHYMAQWLRQAVHHQAVMRVGIQPNLVAGVYMRTKNRVYDFSLRHQLRAQRPVLAKVLESLRGDV